jgi:hypothetical protein
MKTSTKIAFLFIGALLLVSAIFSFVLSKQLIQITLLALLGLITVILAFTKKERKEIVLESKLIKKNPSFIVSITLVAILISGGVGYIFGQLLYHVIN